MFFEKSYNGIGQIGLSGKQVYATIILSAFYHKRKYAVCRAVSPIIPVAEKVSPDERFEFFCIDIFLVSNSKKFQI